MNAMVITIGVGKNGEDIANAILYSIKNHNPNFILFLCSKVSKENTFNKYIEPNIKTKYEYVIEEEDEIDDVESLYKSYKEKIINILIHKNKFKPENIIADFTSGTKAMSAALVSVAFSLEIRTLSYIYGKRKEGTVIPGTERINTLSPTYVFTEKKLKVFIDLFNLYQFDSAINIFSNFEIYYEFKEKIDNYITLAKAYNAWDKFNFKEANSLFNNIKTSNKFFSAENIKVLKKQKLILEKINQNSSLNDLIIKDLYENAYRRYEEGKFDDAVARLYRVLEMIGQINFEKVFGFSTSKVEVDKLPDSIRKEFSNRADEKGFVKLALLDTYKVLNEIENPLGIKFFKNYEELKKILGARNNSILAHGTIPIEQSTFEKLAKKLKDFYDFEGYPKFIKLSI